MSSFGTRHSNAEVEARIRGFLAAEAAQWLESRRWYADKGRPVVGIDVADQLVEDIDGDALILTVANVRFANAESALYFLPLALVRRDGDADSIASIGSGSELGILVDATETTWFGVWLLEAIAGRANPDASSWLFAVGQDAAHVIAEARRSQASLLRAEQSNTSLRFGDAAIVKLIRRLQPGPNPDEEVLRALASAGFRRVPGYVGSISWRAADGTDYPIALAQAFIPNYGDGWSWMLERLARIAAGSADEADVPERLLGRRTAELHLALSAIAGSEFEPILADGESIASDITRTQGAMASVLTLMQERGTALPDAVRLRLPALGAALPEITARAEGFRAEEGMPRIRVHGDYHLGQVLRTRDDDWVIIDFEGEPARPVSERRQKASVLKDVAGMLRSFGYARGVAERTAHAIGNPNAAKRLQVWEQSVRQAFLEEYRIALRASRSPLVPEHDGAFYRALNAWELDKALYEIAYEARNRPDWLELPLRSLLPEVFDQPAEATGGAPA